MIAFKIRHGFVMGEGPPSQNIIFYINLSNLIKIFLTEFIRYGNFLLQL
jgi:hypothetical protein